MHQNGVVHGNSEEERRTKFREKMRKTVDDMLADVPEVESSRRHLFEDVQKVRRMRYRQQKAWTRNVYIEIEKEKQRKREESRSMDIQQQMVTLRAIGRGLQTVHKRRQQQIMRYFTLPQPLSEMKRDE